ncbi:13942_t:CDS:2, partial [Cetraspora pellucida]
SIGTCYNVPITFGYGDNSCTITKDFPVMDDDKPWILLGTPLLDRAGWEPIVKLHKSQREIFKPEINLTFHKQDKSKTRSSASSVQVSTDGTKCRISDSSSSQSSNNDILLEKWHAPAGFSPDFSLSSEDDLLQSKSLDDELEMSQAHKSRLCNKKKLISGLKPCIPCNKSQVRDISIWEKCMNQFFQDILLRSNDGTECRISDETVSRGFASSPSGLEYDLPSFSSNA